jgi:VWFA-related protein
MARIVSPFRPTAWSRRAVGELSDNRRMQGLTRAWRSSVAVVLVAGPLLAQAPAAPPATPRFETAVTLVTLPVFVTGKDGKPVPGLTAADFEVTDDGKPAVVAAVQEVDASEPQPASDSPSPSVQATARRQFLFLFDLSFSNPAGIVRARDAALKFAREGLAPSDLAGVATFSVNNGMRMLLGLTTDREQFARAVSTLGVLHVQKSADPLGLTYELSPSGLNAIGASAGHGDDWVEHVRQQALSMRRGEDAQYAQRVNDYLLSMQRLARALDNLRGRKQVILLSGGFDQTALMGASGQQAADDSNAVVEGRIWEVQSESRFGDAKARSVMDDMAKAFAAADVVVNAVDVNGLVARGDPTEAVPGMRLGGGRESLNQMAGLTGGRVVKDTNDVAGALGQLAEASRRYYVLALEPSVKGAGKFHRLKVRVKGRGLDVSHRPGYLEPAPAAASADAGVGRMQAAEAIAKGLTGGELDVRAVAVPYRDAQGNVALPVVLEVEGESLLRAGAKGDLPLEVYGYAFDDKGTVVDLMALTPRITVEKLGARLRQSGLQFHTAFAVAPGRYDLRFLVRDASSGRMGSRRIEAVVPAFAQGTVALSPPLFMSDPAQRVVLQTPTRNNAAPEMPFRVDSDLFTPQGLPRLANGRGDSVCVLAFSPTPFDAKTSFQISAYLTDEHGGRVPLGAPLALTRVVGEPDGFRRFVLKLTPSGVPPGQYTFRVKLKDPLAAEAVESATPVRVD